MAKQAVLIGAGQYGRGVIAMLLNQSGYNVLLADVNEAVIKDINERHEYSINRITDTSSTVCVKNVSAINSKDPQLSRKLADSDIICTCVGLSVLPIISRQIADSVKIRYSEKNESKINILACENALGGSTILKRNVVEQLNEDEVEYLESHIGFPDCAIDGIIPPCNNNLPADVTAEEYYEWDSLKSGFIGEIPEIEGLHVVDDLSMYLERKLFTLNGPNAVTGCMGFVKGYTTVQESLNNQEIYNTVWEMMAEAGQMLCNRHGFTADENLQYREFIMKRFQNPNIIDSCERVAREPIRKLAANDRIVAAMNYAHEFGIETPAYYKGIAYIMKYNNPNDKQSIEIQNMIEKYGFYDSLEKLTGITKNESFSQIIKDEYDRIK